MCCWRRRRRCRCERHGCRREPKERGGGPGRGGARGPGDGGAPPGVFGGGWGPAAVRWGSPVVRGVGPGVLGGGDAGGVDGCVAGGVCWVVAGAVVCAAAPNASVNEASPTRADASGARRRVATKDDIRMPAAAIAHSPQCSLRYFN